MPGTFVQYDPAADLLTLRDRQWEAGGGVLLSLNTVSWDGQDDVALLDSLDLPDGAGTILARGSRIYFDTYAYTYVDYYYTSGYGIYAVSLEPDGSLSLGEEVKVTDNWASLLDARGTTAYVSIGNAVARYDFSGEDVFRDLTETMGTPASVRFGATTVRVLLGYSGMIRLPL